MVREMKDNPEMVKIDLGKFLLTYLHKWWLIVLCALLVGGGALLYTMKMVTPLYQASITIYVNNVRSGERIDYISGSNLQASQQLVNTYSNIIRSNTVLSKVAEEAGVRYTPSTMRSLLSTKQVGETEMFNVYITHPDPEEAAHLANAVANVAPVEIENFVEGSSAKVIDYAKVPTSCCSPSYSRSAIFGAGVGGVLAVIYLTLRCLLDVRIKEEDDLTAMFDLPVLGQIPNFSHSSGGKKSAYAAPYAKKGGNG